MYHYARAGKVQQAMAAIDNALDKAYQQGSREQIIALYQEALNIVHVDPKLAARQNEFAEAIGRKLPDLERALSGATGDQDEIRQAWATALALDWLARHAQDVEHEWRMLAAKARTWLDTVRAVPADGGAWADAAAKFLQEK